MALSLFDLVVPQDKLHPSFEVVRTHPAKAPARAALSNIFATFKDPDGNFINEFQGVAFDARLFELYLHAYFSRSGFKMDREHPRPDFLVERDGLKVAVEATTTNRSQGGVLAATRTPVADLRSRDEIAEYTDGELAVRLSGPLNAKLKAAYWNEPHVKGHALVFAIETFHDPHSLMFTDSSLTQYVLGLRAEPTMTERGELVVSAAEIEEHRKATKVVVSGFFDQPGAEHVSAVVFTNAGTVAKFSRMGYQAGVGRETIHIVRRGTAYDPEPSAMLPRFFTYNLDAAPRVETWGEGLSVVHNPNARIQLPNGYFPVAVDNRLINGEIVSFHPAWHPFASTTNVLYDPDKARRGRVVEAPLEIRAITKETFHRLVDASPLAALAYREEVWLADSTKSFLGVVVFDREDSDWGFAVFAPDHRGTFRPVEQSSSLRSREDAGAHIWHHMEKRLASPQRVFPK